MKVISLVNNKGGSSKTSLALNLAGVLSKEGKVLVLDLDPQINSTIILSASKGEGNIYDVLVGRKRIGECIRESDFSNIDFIEGSNRLRGYEPTNEEYLGSVLKGVDGYDYIVIDTSTHLDNKVLGSINTSDIVVIPILLDLFSSQGLVRILGEVRKVSNKVKVMVVPTQVVHNSKLHRNVKNQLEDYIEYQDNAILSKNSLRYSVEMSNTLSERKLIVNGKGFHRLKTSLNKLGKELIEYGR